MNYKWKYPLLAAAVVACLDTAVQAGSFAKVWIMGNTDNGTDWSSSLPVTAGETVYYEVIAELATTTVTNSTKPYTLVQPQVAGTDGLNSLALNLTDTSAGATLVVPTLDAAWNQHTGQTAGNVSGNTISGIVVSAGLGNYLGGTSATQILTGSFVAGSSASDTFIASWNSNNNGSIKVDTTAGQKSVGLSSTTEGGIDPYIGYTALTLTESAPAVPAPSILDGMLVLAGGLGVVYFARRRRLVMAV